MSDSTAISWTDATWNPITGCTKVSPGCKHCYMFREMRRYGRDPERVSRTVTTFDAPLKRTRDGAWKWPDGDDVFTASWSDIFIEEADPWRGEFWSVIRQRPGLRFFVLTKRADRIAAHLPPDWGSGYPNVILGVSVENAEHLWRVAELVKVRAVGRMVSAEPLLGDLTDSYPDTRALHRMDWIVAGGESGSIDESRPSHPRWFRSLRDLADEYDIPFHFKQHGAWYPLPRDPDDEPEWLREMRARGGLRCCVQGTQVWAHVGAARAGRLLDGVEHNDRPRVGRVPRA